MCDPNVYRFTAKICHVILSQRDKCHLLSYSVYATVPLGRIYCRTRTNWPFLFSQGIIPGHSSQFLSIQISTSHPCSLGRPTRNLWMCSKLSCPQCEYFSSGPDAFFILGLWIICFFSEYSEIVYCGVFWAFHRSRVIFFVLFKDWLNWIAFVLNLVSELIDAIWLLQLVISSPLIHVLII